MSQIFKADCSGADAYVDKTVTFPGSPSDIYVEFDVFVPATTLTNIRGASDGFSATFLDFQPFDGVFLGDGTTASLNSPTTLGTNYELAPVAGAFSADAWHTIKLHIDAAGNWTWQLDGVTEFTNSVGSTPTGSTTFHFGGWSAFDVSGEIYYLNNIKVGSTLGGSEYFADDFEGGDLSAWDTPSGSVSVVDDPTPPPVIGGRVLIAFDDGPLVASPTWTVIDQAGDFPDGFVSGYDTRVGRQTLLSQTDTGTATVYINDHELALFDPRNMSSPYHGKLDGVQIKLQLWDPIAGAWEPQFRGWIDDITWDIDGSAVDANGDPINASIQIECVDMFDFLAGYGLTPGLDGVTPRTVPSGSAGGPTPSTSFDDGVYYAATAGTVDDRIIEILADVGIDPDRYLVASGNVHCKEVKYDPDESALQALRDAADAELPFIANIYCDRKYGRFNFRGRYSRFYPDDVAAEPGSDWDFTRWKVGDGKAIQADADRAQMRVLSFGRNRSDIVNVAIGYPQDLEPADMPGQVFANTASITAYGKHSAPPMSDLLLDKDVTQPVSGFTGKVEAYSFAKLLVLNQKDPRENITALQVKAIRPTDPRAEKTWALLTRIDISHIVNVAVGYPGGTGLAGDSPEDDYYVEERSLTVRPLNPTHDYVELELGVSPAVWSMDLNGVFPNPFA